nr:MAG TPA: hypothetical protein [Caudoviricetes sp.]
MSVSLGSSSLSLGLFVIGCILFCLVTTTLYHLVGLWITLLKLKEKKA